MSIKTERPVVYNRDIRNKLLSVWPSDVPQRVRTTPWGLDSLLNKKWITVQIKSITPLPKFSDLDVSKSAVDVQRTMAHRWPKDSINNSLHNSLKIRGCELRQCYPEEKFLYHLLRMKGDGHSTCEHHCHNATETGFCDIAQNRKNTQKDLSVRFWWYFLFCIKEHADHFTIGWSGDFLYSRKILQYMRDGILHQIYLLHSNREPTTKYWLTEDGLSQQRIWI